MIKLIKYGLLSLGAILLIVFALKGRIPHEKFDSEKWKKWTDSQNESEWSLRWDMMNSLRNNDKLKGMTKDEILELLGEPESKTSMKFIYYLGYSKHGMSTGQLRIVFGENNQVADFSVWDG